MDSQRIEHSDLTEVSSLHRSHETIIDKMDKLFDKFLECLSEVRKSHRVRLPDQEKVE